MRDRRPAVGPARRLHRRPSGDLHDIDDEHDVAIGDLIEDVRAGKCFQVQDTRTGADCTQQVLLEVLTRALLPDREPVRSRRTHPRQPAPPADRVRPHLRTVSRTDPDTGARNT